jgi:hypothetical protein
MSITFDGFCGPSYQLENRFAAVERCVNWYLSPNEAQEEKKTGTSLVPCPCNAKFSQLPVPWPFNQPCRGLLEYRGNVIGVNGSQVYSLDGAGVYRSLGAIQNDGAPVSMVANGAGQIFIASAGYGYVIDAQNMIHVLTPGVDFLGASFSTFQDGYIINIIPNSNKFQISGDTDTPLGSALVWDPTNITVMAGQADLLKAVISSREYLRFFGARRSQIYRNVGNTGIGGFPFQSYSETFIETGIAAPHSLADFGDSLVWIGEDFRGQRACWIDFGFMPKRTSTFAIEQMWQRYKTVEDAVAFPFIWKGHSMYQITFPSEDVTWVYDKTVSELLGRSVWFERQSTDNMGRMHSRSERFHCFCYGKHLVGSTGSEGNPGAVYAYSEEPFSDCGVDVDGNQAQMPVVRDRICPHLWDGNKRIIYDRIELEMNRGNGLDFGLQPGSDPQLILRWSNDAGHNWGPEQMVSTGAVGDFKRRVYWNRCGYARDRVFWVRSTDPVYCGFVGAELDIRVCSS